MAIDRRSFLALLGAVPAIAAELDIEKLLWIPKKKTIFLPSPPKIILADFGFLLPQVDSGGNLRGRYFITNPDGTCDFSLYFDNTKYLDEYRGLIFPMDKKSYHLYFGPQTLFWRKKDA